MTIKITDEAVTAVALSLAEEVRKWPADSSLPYDSRVGVGRTFRELARVAIEAALPHLEGATPAIDREQISERLAEAMADSWMGDEVDCVDVATILTPAVVALIGGGK